MKNIKGKLISLTILTFVFALICCFVVSMGLQQLFMLSGIVVDESMNNLEFLAIGLLYIFGLDIFFIYLFYKEISNVYHKINNPDIFRSYLAKYQKEMMYGYVIMVVVTIVMGFTSYKALGYLFGGLSLCALIPLQLDLWIIKNYYKKARI
ncbi:MAG: hypothetical protein MR210_05485 [Erysipelotrichaceae bacterium]|nr:hypothetical protein [Erysipelotrichaceae bacterium]MDY5251955.1 hypothetical protein [Erysipelotrichaceae bacterium]